jgi:hypothetical protein
MPSYNIFYLVSYAFRSGCSFFGGRPALSVLSGVHGEFVFLFKPDKYGNIFFQWVRWNHDSTMYEEKTLFWRGQEWKAIFLKTYFHIPSKFLFAFRQFAKFGKNKVFLFN